MTSWAKNPSELNNTEVKDSYRTIVNMIQSEARDNVEVKDLNRKYNKSIQVLAGDRTGADKSPTEAY